MLYSPPLTPVWHFLLLLKTAHLEEGHPLSTQPALQVWKEKRKGKKIRKGIRREWRREGMTVRVEGRSGIFYMALILGFSMFHLDDHHRLSISFDLSLLLYSHSHLYTCWEIRFKSSAPVSTWFWSPQSVVELVLSAGHLVSAEFKRFSQLLGEELVLKQWA